MLADELDGAAKMHANLAAAAYMSDDAANEVASQYGYNLIKDDSDADRKLFANDAGNAIIAFRGTDLKNKKNTFRDVLNDAAIMFGKQHLTPRFQKSEQSVANALKKYNTVSTTGHSLGASQSMHVARNLGVTSYAYNPAFSIPHIAQSIKDRILYGKQPKEHNKVFTTYYDPISIAANLSLGARVHRVRQREQDPHTIRNFL